MIYINFSYFWYSNKGKIQCNSGDNLYHFSVKQNGSFSHYFASHIQIQLYTYYWKDSENKFKINQNL